MNEVLKACFYPTPKKLVERMLAKVKGYPSRILEPSAGKGDIVDILCGHSKDYMSNGHWYTDQLYRNSDISTIEIDPDLQATLRGKGHKVIDSDFLEYSGADQFDLIIANPPFNEGDKHLLKAINIMYRGEIVFLLNSETIVNPCTNTRKELLKKLVELKAEIEHIPGAFKDAERPTGVSVALVYINIQRKVEDDLFKGVDDKARDEKPEIEKDYELSNKRVIEELVAEYNQVLEIGKETIVSYYRNYKKIGSYLVLNDKPDHYSFNANADMTELMQGQLNGIIKSIRHDFWRRTLDLPEVKGRMTEKKRKEFEEKVSQCCDMDFTENNIRQFVLNVIAGYQKTLEEGVLEVFDRLTIRHHWSDDNLYSDNIHYFNGWKTNKAFKVGKRVILPLYGSVTGWDGKWERRYDTGRDLHDLDVVMSYFDGMERGYLGILDAIDAAFKRGQSRGIHSTYFTISVYKKGTVHLEFNDDNILRRFNIAACLGKNWLPGGYGKKHPEQCTQEEKEVIESFEGMTSYIKNIGQPVFDNQAPLQLAQLNEVQQ